MNLTLLPSAWPQPYQLASSKAHILPPECVVMCCDVIQPDSRMPSEVEPGPGLSLKYHLFCVHIFKH